jgi:hypothetical protein
MRRVAIGHGLGHLKGLLHRVGHDGRGRLHPVPRALGAQARSHNSQLAHAHANGPGAQQVARWCGHRSRVRLRHRVRNGVRSHDDAPVGNRREVIGQSCVRNAEQRAHRRVEFGCHERPVAAVNGLERQGGH